MCQAQLGAKDAAGTTSGAGRQRVNAWPHSVGGSPGKRPIGEKKDGAESEGKDSLRRCHCDRDL